MIIDKAIFEAMIIFLYNTKEYEACDKVFTVYKRIFFETSIRPHLQIVNEASDLED